MTTAEAARDLGLNPRTLRAWVARGYFRDLPPLRPGRGDPGFGPAHARRARAVRDWFDRYPRGPGTHLVDILFPEEDAPWPA